MRQRRGLSLPPGQVPVSPDAHGLCLSSQVPLSLGRGVEAAEKGRAEGCNGNDFLSCVSFSSPFE